MQARYYDPVIGRFYSNDPLGFRDVHSFNRYAYANNNPYRYIDPDGKASFSIDILNLVKSDEGVKLASNAQKSMQKDAKATLETGIATTATVASTVNTATPSGATMKLASAAVVAGLVASSSETPVETFVIEMGSELIGGGAAKKVESLTKSLPDVPLVGNEFSDNIKDLASAFAGDAVKDIVKEEMNESQ